MTGAQASSLAINGSRYLAATGTVALQSVELASFARPTILNPITRILNLRIDNPHDNDNREPLSGKNFRFAIVASRWNDSLVTRLVAGAVQALKEADVDDDSIEIYRVPGAFEISLCALKAAESGKFDAVICLGVIIRGETPHFDFIAAATAHGITDAGLKTGVPLLFGVITADNIDQATARAGAKQDNKGYEAAVAAVEVVNLYKQSFR